MPRYFYALWPEDPIRDRIHAAVEQLPVKGRRVRQANLHITLVFLGSVDESTIGDLVTGTGGIEGQSFSLILEAVGWWQRPRVVWLAPAVCPPALPRLVQGLNALVETHRIQVDPRPYRPHLTIARKVARYRGPDAIVPITWNISDFCLVKSNTRSEGVEYEVVARWPLSNAPAPAG